MSEHRYHLVYFAVALQQDKNQYEQYFQHLYLFYINPCVSLVLNNLTWIQPFRLLIFFPVANLLWIGKDYRLHSVFPLVVATCKWLFLTKINVFSIVPNFHIKIFVIVGLKFKYQISCKIRTRLAVESCRLSFSVKIFLTSCRRYVEGIEVAVYVIVVTEKSSPL